ncbi:MAG: dTMP kinase [Candidatus Babeliaceae bacterium]|nr:dTMP kinase [Candidatus Babeliaceae bacterium]
MKRSKGLLIVFEGIDGAGKTTLLTHVADILYQAGFKVVQTRQPGGTPLGERIRSILHDSPDRPCPLSEFLLFAADRAQHLEEIVRPALEMGKIVLSDRFADSSAAYQGAGRGVSSDFIGLVNDEATGGIHPDLTIYVRLDPKIAAQRLVGRPEKQTAIEREPLEFFTRIASWFDTHYGDRDDVLMLDAQDSPSELGRTAAARISTLLQEKGVVQ